MTTGIDVLAVDAILNLKVNGLASLTLMTLPLRYVTIQSAVLIKTKPLRKVVSEMRRCVRCKNVMRNEAPDHELYCDRCRFEMSLKGGE